MYYLEEYSSIKPLYGFVAFSLPFVVVIEILIGLKSLSFLTGEAEKLQENATLTIVSNVSIREGSYHDVIAKDHE